MNPMPLTICMQQLANTAQTHLSKKNITFLKELDAASVPGALFLLMAYIPCEIPVLVLKLHELRSNLELIIIC